MFQISTENFSTKNNEERNILQRLITNVHQVKLHF
jgi:hypothetical protein